MREKDVDASHGRQFNDAPHISKGQFDSVALSNFQSADCHSQL